MVRDIAMSRMALRAWACTPDFDRKMEIIMRSTYARRK